MVNIFQSTWKNPLTTEITCLDQHISVKSWNSKKSMSSQGSFMSNFWKDHVKKKIVHCAKHCCATDGPQEIAWTGPATDEYQDQFKTNLHFMNCNTWVFILLPIMMKMARSVFPMIGSHNKILTNSLSKGSCQLMHQILSQNFPPSSL